MYEHFRVNRFIWRIKKRRACFLFFLTINVGISRNNYRIIINGLDKSNIVCVVSHRLFNDNAY